MDAPSEHIKIIRLLFGVWLGACYCPASFGAEDQGGGCLPPVGTGGYSHLSPSEKVLVYGCSFGAYHDNIIAD